MTFEDLQAIAKGMAPVMIKLVEDETARLKERLAELEAQVGALKKKSGKKS